MQKLNKIAIFLISIAILISLAKSQQVADDKQPFLRIIAPKFICPDEKLKQNQKNSSSRVTIGLQTSEGQRLKYKIAINFDILDGFQNQRHTLSIWKHVRELQAKLATKNVSDEISLKNQIEIDSKELTPQVIYTFKIVGVDENNVASMAQDFTITYKGDELQASQSNTGDGVSLFLFGAESFRSDAEFLAVADVSFCDPINDYYYQWKIDGLTADGADYLDVRGNILKIPPGILEEAKLYEVRVTILNKRNEAMATVSLPVKIFAVEFEVQNVPAACSVGISKAVPFSTLIYRQTNVQNLKIKWTCSDECDNYFANTTDDIQTTMSFTKDGKFTLKTAASLREINKESTTDVTVDPKVIPYAVMKYFPLQPIDTMVSNEFVATIMDLVPKCEAKWTLLDGKAKGDVTNLGAISISDYEEHFLNELVDYDNSTLSKDITMKIAPQTLKADEKYKFRLNINCPEPITDLNATDRKNVMTFYDIIVESNGPPSVLDLEIFPLQGIPMKQEYKFSTGAAKDRQSDYPLKYTFGYKVNDLSIVIGIFYENQVAHTQLPYAENIQTYYEVCDNNNACITKDGPQVAATQPHKYTEKEINSKLDEIRGSLARSEYQKVLNSVVVLILTQRQIKGDSKEIEKRIVEMLKDQLSQLKANESSKFVYQQRIVEFVTMSENLMRVMAINDDEFIENILSLTESRSRARQKRFSFLGIDQKNIVSRNPDFIKSSLKLSDVLLSSSDNEVVKREKKRFVTKIHQFVASLCGDRNLNAKIIQSKFVACEVSKIFSRHLYSQAQKFPPDEKSSIIFSQNSNFASKFICMGKIKYVTDVYDVENKEKEEVYETLLMDDFGTENPSLIEAKNVGEHAVMEFVGDASNVTNENSCQLWSNLVWDSKACEKQIIESKKIICKCKTLSTSMAIKYGRLGEKSNENSGSNEVSDTTKAPAENVESATGDNQNSQGGMTQKPEDVTQSSITLKPSDASSVTTESSTKGSGEENSNQGGSNSNTGGSNTNDGSANSGGNSNQGTPSSGSTSSNLNPEPTKSPSEKASTILKDKVSTASIKSVTPGTTSKPSQNPAIKGTTKASTSASLIESSTSSVELLELTTTMNTSDNSQNVSEASVSWTLIIFLMILFLAIIVVFLLYKCRNYTRSHVNLPMRQPSKGIKYARYHDEFIMRG